MAPSQPGNNEEAAIPTPPLLDLTIDNITQNVVRINSQSGDARLNYLMERLVTHIHDFARETRLSTHEWTAAIQFLTQTGQICSEVRQVRFDGCYCIISPRFCLSFLFSLLSFPPDSFFAPFFFYQ